MGLPSNTVFDAKQSAEGYLWLGTNKGLCKYDGVNFTPYSTPAQNGKGVTDIFEVENGEVYCQNFSGQLFYTRGDSLLLEKAVGTTNNYYPLRKVNNNLLFFNDNTIYSLNRATGNVKKYYCPNAIFQFSCVVNNVLYFFDMAGRLFAFDGQGIKNTGLYQNALNKQLHSIPQGILLAKKSGNKTLEILRLNGRVETIAGIDENAMLHNIVTLGNDVWLCTSAGAYRYNKNMQPVGNGPLFSNYRISSVLQDKEGAYWFTTLDNGLLYVPNISVQIANTTNNDIHLSALANGPGNSILVGTTNNSLQLYNPAYGKFTELCNSSVLNDITACLYDAANNHYLYSSNGLYQVKNKRVINKGGYAIKDMVTLWPGIYAFAFSNGSIIYNHNSAYIPQWLSSRKDLLGNYTILPGTTRAKAIEANPADTTIYVADVKGLFKFDKGVINEIKYNNQAIIATSLKLYKGKIYIGTYAQGILSYTISNGKVDDISRGSVGKPGVYRIDAYKDRLFFVSENGLYAYHLITHRTNHWNFTDGLPEAEIADMLIKNDTAYLATYNGLVVLNINTPDKNPVAPPIYISKVLSNDGLVNMAQMAPLPYKNNKLEVWFAIPAYKGGKHIRVFYRLNDDKWEAAPTGNRVLQFSSLAAGSYTLQIKAVNEDGVESAKPLELVFTVKQPFYQTWWFIALLLLVVIVAGRLLYLYRVNKLIKKQMAELEKQDLKRRLDLSTLKTLRAQMNPHFIHNALNSIQSYVYSGEKELASKYLTLFSDLSRSLLDSSSLTEITLHDEIKLIELYLQLECIRLPKIKYEIKRQSGLQEYVIHIPAMILQPLVENAVNHGFANKTENCYLELRFTENNNTLVVEIEDNGIGRVKSAEINLRKNKKYQSFSMQAIEDRISILNKNRKKPIEQAIIDKYDANNNPCGTFVKLSIPIEDYD